MKLPTLSQISFPPRNSLTDNRFILLENLSSHLLFIKMISLQGFYYSINERDMNSLLQLLMLSYSEGRDSYFRKPNRPIIFAIKGVVKSFLES